MILMVWVPGARRDPPCRFDIGVGAVAAATPVPTTPGAWRPPGCGH